LPAAVAKIEFDFRIVGGEAREVLGDNSHGGAVDAFRLGERGFDWSAKEPDHVGRAFVGAEIKGVAVGLRVKDMAEQETLERRDIGGGDCRLDDSGVK